MYQPPEQPSQPGLPHQNPGQLYPQGYPPQPNTYYPPTQQPQYPYGPYGHVPSFPPQHPYPPYPPQPPMMTPPKLPKKRIPWWIWLIVSIFVLGIFRAIIPAYS